MYYNFTTTMCQFKIVINFVIITQIITIASCKLNLFSTISTHSNVDFNYETKYLEVPIDHFSFTGNRTFLLRYLINDTYWKSQKNGPIFFYTGNEGDIEMFAENTGFMWESAIGFNALLLFAEHRYYGKSMPFGNDSAKNEKYFGYLSSQQALADFVDVIEHVKEEYKMVDIPVIAFGGSYGGMLSAWMRMKYPAVIQGALAASAPIWQFTGMVSCLDYNRVLTHAYIKTGGHICVDNVRESWKAINNLNTPSGRKWISQEWKFCHPLQNETDMKTFKNWLIDVYSNIAMINYPYESNFIMPVPANPVQKFCSLLNNTSLRDKELLSTLSEAFLIYFNYTGKTTCLNWKIDSAPSLGEGGWDIQSCFEMVMPICSNGITDMFEKTEWNFTKYSDKCFKKYNIRPMEKLAEKEYGGKRLETASNIIFSNGDLDPWMSGGVTHDVSPSTSIVIIKNGAHHLDLRSSNPKDPVSVKSARRSYVTLFKRWIKEYQQNLMLKTQNYERLFISLKKYQPF